jgi:site-specific recombinase XerD
MASFNIELNSTPVKGSNQHKILLRITINRQHIREALMYSCTQRQFNPNGKGSKYIRDSHPNHAKINSYIEQKIGEVKDIISGLEKDGKAITISSVKAKLQESKQKDFFKFVEERIQELEKSKSIGTFKKYTAVLNSIKEYHETDSLMFDEITQQFLNKYQTFLLDNGKQQTTVHGYFSKIRTLFNKAASLGIIDFGSNPFLIFKLRQGKPIKDRLTEEEISKIENLKFPEGSLIWNVKNAFLFSFYNAGVRISDILMLTWNNIQDGRLVYKMYKTGKPHSLLLKEKPLAILELYKNSGESYIFPFLEDRYNYSDALFLHNQIGSKTALINSYLKDIAEKAGIKKNVTTHTARHSFADIARKKTDNLYNLSKALGHSSLKVTEAYLASFDESAIDDTLNKMF